MTYFTAELAETPIRIVGHPQRRDMALKLAMQVGATVVWDTEESGSHLQRCARTHQRALAQLAGAQSPFVVVLEDDALPVGDFRWHLAGALRYAPAPVVGLYLGTGHLPTPTQQCIRRAVATARWGAAWITADCLIGSVGYAVWTSKVPDLLDFIAPREEELPLRISRWVQDRRVNVAYTAPSLVDHDDGETIGKPWRGPHFPRRKAWWYGTRESWNTPAVPLGQCPTWSAP